MIAFTDSRKLICIYRSATTLHGKKQNDGDRKEWELTAIAISNSEAFTHLWNEDNQNVGDFKKKSPPVHWLCPKLVHSGK